MLQKISFFAFVDLLSVKTVILQCFYFTQNHTSMKNLVKFLSFAALFAAFTTSCTEDDPCKDVVCGDYGNCNEGVCECVYGYEQDADGLCNTTWSAKFAAGPNAPAADTVYGDNGSSSLLYNMTVSVVDSVNLSTTNLGGFGSTNVVDMEATSSYDLLINDTDIAGRVFNGTGTINGNQITLNYTVTYNDNTVDTCETVITK